MRLLISAAQRDAVGLRAGGVHRHSLATPGPHSLFTSPEMGRAHTHTHTQTHPHYLTLLGFVEPEPLFGCRRQLSFCAKKGVRAIETLHERKRGR